MGSVRVVEGSAVSEKRVAEGSAVLARRAAEGSAVAAKRVHVVGRGTDSRYKRAEEAGHASYNGHLSRSRLSWPPRRSCGN
ncbi:hypothetical protein EYF80_063335 [Liparis tanakae]|uniref:Uncharacterized protein n=1 Tax=Liparis tanakae TaxID=230148 RepID=A0A4Z2ECH2_9TELE|nr:hypothetical protein EYF80_063335 [Liparis tanakae]